MNSSNRLSANRLNGEPVPEDLQLLLPQAVELERRTGIRIVDDEQWCPWADTSYLSPADLKDPGIAANIKAMAEVCSYIAFVAEQEDRQYLGYWRGPSGRTIAESPLVWLDNEGQFSLCAQPTFAQAVLASDFAPSELMTWMESLGFRLDHTATKPPPAAEGEADPKDLHWALQARYAAADSL